MEGECIVGRNPVMEILKSDRKVHKIFIAKGELKGSINKIIKKAEEKNIIIQYVSKNKLDELSRNGVHQGVIASVSPYEYSSIDEIFLKAKTLEEDPFIVLLDEIEDPHNLGSIIRTAECAGAHGVIIPKRRSAAVNQTVVKTSAGATEHILISKITNMIDTIRELKDKGLWIYGADILGKDYYFNTDMNGPIGLVIGNEGKGISRLVKENCDFLVKIPVMGNISSLNASNAASIILYEIVRQRHGK